MLTPSPGCGSRGTPEVLLDRFVRNHLCHEPGCSAYQGKLDLGKVETRLGEFLYHIQEVLNEELRLEGVNASGGVSHPPFHFDYVDVGDGVRNAHAFQHDGFAFIVITFPLVKLIGQLSFDLSRSERVMQLLHFDSAAELDGLQQLFFDILLHFLVSHEYTHHVHAHGVNHQEREKVALWTEFLQDIEGGNLLSQAQELDADGYATYLVLAYLLRGDGRVSALGQLGHADASQTEGDELLLACFFLSVFAFFCEFWQRCIDMNSVASLTHPPAPVRITYTIRVVEMWVNQNASIPASWFADEERFQQFFQAAADIIQEAKRTTWDLQMRWLQSTEGERYDQELFDAFNAVRQKKRASGEPNIDADLLSQPSTNSFLRNHHRAKR